MVILIPKISWILIAWLSKFRGGWLPISTGFLALLATGYGLQIYLYS